MPTQQINTLASAQALSANWRNVGSEQSTEYKRSIGIWLDIDINDSENVQIRALARYESGGSNYVLPIKAVTTTKITVQAEYTELANDADQTMLIEIETNKTVPFIQLQAKAGTVGASAGTITARSSVGRY